MITIGIDPDLHTTAIAVVSDGRLSHIAVCRVPKTKKGAAAVIEMASSIITPVLALERQLDHIDAFAVEGQQIYAGKTKNYNDILHLSQVAGIALSAFARILCSDTLVRMPNPSEWNHSLPKEVVQGRAWAKLGIPAKVRGGGDPYCVPTHYERGLWMNLEPNEGDWKHLSDAVALALWVREQHKKVDRLAPYRPA